jgi:hypothetical protein
MRGGKDIDPFAVFNYFTAFFFPFAMLGGNAVYRYESITVSVVSKSGSCAVGMVTPQHGIGQCHYYVIDRKKNGKCAGALIESKFRPETVPV